MPFRKRKQRKPARKRAPTEQPPARVVPVLQADVTGRRGNGQFAPGVSGNPRGRPVGPSTRTIAEQSAAARGTTLDGDIGTVLEALRRRGLKGNVPAAALWLDRVAGRVPLAAKVEHTSGDRFDDLLRRVWNLPPYGQEHAANTTSANGVTPNHADHPT